MANSSNILLYLVSSLYGSEESPWDHQELTDVDGLVHVIKLLSNEFEIHAGQARAGASLMRRQSSAELA